MNHLLKLSLCALAGTAMIACGNHATTQADSVPYAELESGFITPPDSILTSVYWYWISNNISEERSARLFESMKKAGINRAFIGNIGQDDVPYGNVEMLSEEWWKILHAALKKATELNIEIGIFNSPGWSQSGGPWVTAKEAMRYLNSSELRVTGPVKLNQKLAIPADSFQDVRVIAYPAPKGDLVFLNKTNGQVSSTPNVAGLANVIDGDTTTGVTIPAGGTITIDLKANEPFTARSLTIKPTQSPIGANCELQVKEGDDYKSLIKFDINRTNPALNVGFHPYAPVVMSIPATTATDFRVIVTGATNGSGLAENRFGCSSSRGTLQRKDAGQDAPDSAALLERLPMARPTGCRRSGNHRQDSTSARYLSVYECRRNSDMGCTRRRMGDPAYGYDPDRNHQQPRFARSNRIRNGQDES